YNVTITDANSCTFDINDIEITQPAALTATAVQNTPVSCNGGSDGTASVTASGGVTPYSYDWGASNPNALSAGTHTVTVTDFNGCTTTTTVEITEPSVITANAVQTSPVSCNGDSDGSATVNTSGGNGGYTYSWDNGETVATAMALNAGNHTVTITDSKGCQTTASVTITQPEILSATATQVNPVNCFGQSNGSASVTVNGGNPGYSYSWDNGSTTSTATGLNAGLHTVNITDSKGCSTSATVTISQPSQIAISIDNKVDVICNGDNTGSINISATGGTGTFNYSWTGPAGFTSTSKDISGLINGMYIVTVTDSNNCSATKTVIIDQSPELTMDILTFTQPSCNGGNDGTLTAGFVQGGNPGYEYSINNTDWFTSSTFSNISAGSHTIYVKDSEGCTVQGSIMVTEPSILTATAAQISDVKCYGESNGSATVTPDGGNGGFVYLWDNNETGATATKLKSGLHTVTVTDSKGCSTTATVEITQPNPVSVTLDSKTNVLCHGNNTGSINISATGGTGTITYSWTGPSGFTSTSQDLTNLVAGTYVVRATDTRGCYTTFPVTITQPLAFSATIAKTDISCKDANDGSATITTQGGVSPFTYAWSNGGNSITVNNLAAGNYSVTITDANGCTTTASTTINNPTEFIIGGTFTQPSCHGDSDGTATATAVGGTPPYNYLWNSAAGNATTQTVSGLSAGTYSVLITDARGCGGSVIVTVTEPGVLMANARGYEGCFRQGGGWAEATPTGGTGPYTYEWNTGATSQTISGLVAGDYSVTVTDSRGCISATETVTIEMASPFSVEATGINTTGSGLSNGSATAHPTGGDEPFTYLWSDGQTTQTATGLADGTYSVIVTDESGCQATTAINIGDPMVVSLTTTAECLDDRDIQTMIITPNISGGQGPYTLTWDFGADSDYAPGEYSGVQNITYATAGSKLVTLNVQDQTGQSVTTTKIQYIDICYDYGIDCERCVSNDYVFSNFYIGDEDGNKVDQCNGGSEFAVYVYFDIPSDAKPKYNLYVIAGYAVTDPFTGLTVTDSRDECLYEGEEAIPVEGGQGRLLLDEDFICGSEIAITGLLFAWKQRAGLECGPSTPKCYCAIDNLNVTSPLTAFVSNTNVACFGDATATATVEAFGGVEPYSYSWNTTPVQTTATATGLTAGTYSVTVTDANGTTLDPISVTITEPASVPTVTASVVDLNGVNVSCYGETDGEANASASGGTSPYTFEWSDGQIGTSAVDLGIGTYTVTVTDANGCTDTATVTLVGPDPIVTSITSINPLCYGSNNGEATVSVESGGTAPFTYSWSNGDTSATATGLSANISYSVIVTDANGCTTTETVTLSQPPLLTLSNSRTLTSCYGSNDGTATAIPSGGTQPYSYLWDSNAGNQTTSTATGLSAGGPYFVTVTDANGCQEITSVTIIEPNELTATASSTDLLCFGDNNGTVTVIANEGTAPYTYLWDANTGNQTGATATNLPVGTYSVVVTDANGCTTTASATINEPNVLEASITPNTIDCNGGTTEATASVSGGTAPYSYLWSSNANSQTTATATDLTSGTYTVTITDANGCMDSEQVTITEPASLTINSNITAPLCFGSSTGTATVNVSNGTPPYSYLWDTNAGNQTTPTATGLSAGSYSVLVTDNNGCQISTTVNLVDPSDLTATYSVTNPSCYGGSNGRATVIPNGGKPGYTYLWDSNAGNQTTATAIGLSAGSYDVTITDANNCTETISVVLSNPDELTSTVVGTNPVCYGDNSGSATVTANGGTPGYTYLWDANASNQTTPTATGLYAGSYSITVTDSKGCTSTSTVTIANPQILTASMSSTNPTCFGGNDGTATVTPSGGTPNYTYLWSNGQTNQTATGLSAGTNYTVTITDANGCTTSANITLTNPQDLSTANAGNDQTPSCGIESIILSANAPTVGNGSWSIVSPVGGNGASFDNISDPKTTFRIVNSGTYVLRWTISNGGICQEKTDDVQIVFDSCSTLDFDGVDDNVTFNNNFNLSSAFTLETWIKPSSSNNNIQTILSKRAANNLTTGYDIRLVNNIISFNWNSGNTLASPYAIDTTRWYHVAVSYNGTTYILYIDGIEVARTNGTAPVSNNREFILGAMDQTSTPPFRPVNYFHGWMDELKIWNKTLTPDQLHQVMNQEIKNNGGNVGGVIIPLNVANLSWTDLDGYYQMNQGSDIVGGYIIPNAGTVQGKMRNITTWQDETAPLPYTTDEDGYWNDVNTANNDAASPWTYGDSVWDHPNAIGVDGTTRIDWNIVKTSHKITSQTQDLTLLGLLVETNELTITSTIGNQDETNRGHGLWITHYLDLDGSIDLIGESQLVQKRYDDSQISESILEPNSEGFIERDQQGQTNIFNYNYWSSPVGRIRSGVNNTWSRASENMFDGTDTNNPKPITFIGGYDGAATDPISIAEYWLWSYQDAVSNTYASWVKLYKNTGLAAGLGYTMKGSGASTNQQNYTFIGKPRNGDIIQNINSGNSTLVGNPYPCALYAPEFIKDNIPATDPNGNPSVANSGTTGSIDGTLLFWIHYKTNDTHVLKSYQGGYATYTLIGGLKPPTGETYLTSDGFYISGNGSSDRVPLDHIPVAQGFYVSAATIYKTSNDIIFKNSQRAFEREPNLSGITTQVFKSSKTKQNTNKSNDTNIQRLRLSFTTNKGQRPLLLAFTADNSANDEYNYGYDAKAAPLENDMLFTVDNYKLSIQAVGEFDENKQYPFAIFTNNGGAFQIAVSEFENLPNNIKVYVYDSLLGTYTKIDDNNSTFNISLDPGNYTDRFYITFINKDQRSLSVIGEELNKIQVNYLQNNREIYINSPNNVDIKQIQLINILGQTVNVWNKLNAPINSNEIRLAVNNNISQGNYIVNIVTSNSNISKKIIIK
ncbi:LamG-like jellyroll fold domain-containing protein, partial [Aestuariibaculum lutulentum]